MRRTVAACRAFSLGLRPGPRCGRGPGPRQRPPGLIHQLDIMMIPSPVITHQQNRHPHTSQSPDDTTGSQRENEALNGHVSTGNG
jgi:hypothetical protein